MAVTFSMKGLCPFIDIFYHSMSAITSETSTFWSIRPESYIQSMLACQFSAVWLRKGASSVSIRGSRVSQDLASTVGLRGKFSSFWLSSRICRQAAVSFWKSSNHLAEARRNAASTSGSVSIMSSEARNTPS